MALVVTVLTFLLSIPLYTSFDTTTAALMRANHVGPRDVLRIGQQLRVPGRGAPSGPALTRAVTTKSLRYRVRPGDSLARIAGKFDVSVAQIAAWNDLDPSALIHPGLELVLHVQVAAQQT